MTWAALLALAACGSKDAPPPKPAPPPPPPLRVITCADAPKLFEPSPGWGTIGTGRYGTIGHGAGTGPSYGYGPHHDDVSIVSFGGDAAPWRASVTDQYTVIGASKPGVVVGGQPITADPIDKDRVALVVVEHDAPLATISAALTAAAAAPATLVAVRGNAASELVGVAPAPPGFAPTAIELRVQDGLVTACWQGRHLDHPTAVTDNAALVTALGAWRGSCGTKPCELRIAGDSASATDLLAIAASARAGGAPIVGVAPEHECGW
jgi:hypothetical protein